MKRVWKPLDVGGLRLYSVRAQKMMENQKFYNQHFTVAATSPRHAAQLVVECGYGEPWLVTGHALNVLIPEDWWIDGVPDRPK
jgi:hypothetical protein